MPCTSSFWVPGSGSPWVRCHASMLFTAGQPLGPEGGAPERVSPRAAGGTTCVCKSSGGGPATPCHASPARRAHLGGGPWGHPNGFLEFGAHGRWKDKELMRGFCFSRQVSRSARGATVDQSGEDDQRRRPQERPACRGRLLHGGSLAFLPCVSRAAEKTRARETCDRATETCH